MGGFAIPSLATEPIQGDSLTQYLRSLTNNTGMAGFGMLGSGQSMTGTGFGTVGQGVGQLAGAYQTTQPAQDYWNKILSGDPTATAAALGPTAANLNTIYEGAMQNTATGTPLGGYRSVTMSQLPQSQAATIANYLMQLQPTAAQQLQSLAQTQGQIGSGTVSAGGTQGQIGLGTSGIGSSLIDNTLQAILARRGQNIQQDSNMANLVGGLIGRAIPTVGFSGTLSDQDAKEGLIPLGEYKGVPVYAFRYKGDDKVRMGVIAQEVRKIVPEAVHERPDGLLAVDYDYLFGGGLKKAA